jgi:hypothetical protein
VTALAALKSGAIALLDAEGKGDLAAIVAAAELELTGTEEWGMGSREVTAQRLALIVDAPAYLKLTGDEHTLDAVRGAFARAMRTPSTELAELAVVLRLPEPGSRGWHHVYREAPVIRLPERPPPERVLAGAVALLRARGARRARGAMAAAQILSRGALECEDLGYSDTPLVRYVVRLPGDDLAEVQSDGEISLEISQAVIAAGTRASERLARVDFAVKLPEEP